MMTEDKAARVTDFSQVSALPLHAAAALTVSSKHFR